MSTTRRLAAILAADVAGYSRLMAADEVATLAALKAVRREVVDPAIGEHNGRIVKTTGDGLLAEFASAVDAVTCAMAVQGQMAARGGQLTFRIGINVGDIIIDGDDIFGDGVNIAARIEGECEPGSVCLSDDAFRQVRAKTPFGFHDLGERTLKNIDRPIRVYAAHAATASSATTSLPEPGKPLPLPLPLPDKPSIAVLPFQNMSGDPEQDYFADGMVEDIITALSRFKSLFVIARNSSFTYKGKAVDIKQVGRELGVRYVLEGSVRKAGGRVRITGQLIEAATGTHLWADRFDGALEDVFDLQDKVTEFVVSATASELRDAEIARSRRKPTESLDAYDCYLRAIAVVRIGDRDANRNALRWAYRAIELDGEFARAYGQAAMCLSSRKQARWMNDPQQETAEAVRLAQLAVRHGKDDDNALAQGGMTIGYVGGELDEGAMHASRAIALNANSAMAWNVSSWLHVYMGHHATAIAHGSRALRLSPRDFNLSNMLAVVGFAHLFSGNPAEAERLGHEACQVSPRHTSSRRLLATAYALQGKSDQAIRTGAAILELDPTFRLAEIKDVIPLRRNEDLQTYVHGLRLAGLPE